MVNLDLLVVRQRHEEMLRQAELDARARQFGGPSFAEIVIRRMAKLLTVSRLPERPQPSKAATHPRPI